MFVPESQLTKYNGSNLICCKYDIIPKSFLKRHFMIFTPWCDQGMGIQAKNYVYWIHDVLKYNIVVFGTKPRHSINNNLKLQANVDEWNLKDVHIHYSKQDRESVTLEEIYYVVKKYQISDVIFIETCRSKCFEIVKFLNSLNIRVFAIPNIEMIRKDEIDKHQQFHTILCNNVYTKDVFNHFGLTSTKLFPFAFKDIEQHMRSTLHKPGAPVKFLIVGGMNVNKRKQAQKVISGFCKAFPFATDQAQLTILCQGKIDKVPVSTHENINIVCDHFEYKDILNYYGSHHVVIMLSRAEGLGLTTYEALRSGCAVITMNSPIFKEIINAQVNGWMITAFEEEMTDKIKKLVGNTNPIIKTHTFDVLELKALFLQIIDTQDVATLQKGARKSYELMFQHDKVVKQLQYSLSSTPC